MTLVSNQFINQQKQVEALVKEIEIKHVIEEEEEHVRKENMFLWDMSLEQLRPILIFDIIICNND